MFTYCYVREGSRTPCARNFVSVHSDVHVLDSGSSPSGEANTGSPSPPSATPDGEPAVPDRGPARLAVGLSRGAHRVYDPIAQRLGLRESDSAALRAWLISRIGILVILWATVWIEQPLRVTSAASLEAAWEHWDWLRYYRIAQHGYSLNKLHGASIAFFPGFPIILWCVHAVLRKWVISGLLISFVSGAVACCALARIIADYAGPRLEKQAVRNGLIFFLCAPAAVFLSVGYTESIFMAFALPAWLAARKQRWLLAGCLLAVGSAIRINGLFVAAGIAVLFLQSRPGRDLRAWARGIGGLAISVAPVALFFAYLYHLTGSWTAWQRAEASGWGRSFTWPWKTTADTWHRAFGHILPAATAFEYQLEMSAMAVGLGVTIWCAYKRRWAELVYMALSVEALSTSSYFLSVPREGLLWWPLWAGLGVWCVRRPWFKTAYLSVSAPLAGIIAYLFFTGHWAG